MKFKIWLFGILVFLMVFVIRVIQVNTMYPAHETRIVTFGETTRGQNGLEYTIVDAYFIPHDEMTVLFNDVDPEHEVYKQIPGEESELFFIEMKICNPTEKELRMSLPVNAESNAWCNSMDAFVYEYLHPSEDGLLAPSETTTIKIPIFVNKLQLPAEQWEAVRERTYYLMVSLRPEIVKMQLPYMGGQ